MIPRTSLLLVALAAIALMSTDRTPAARAGDEEAVLRVGTYDSRALALAYGRSARPEGFLQVVQGLRAEHRAAQEAGDLDRVAELEKEGPALQERMHYQVFCGAPIPDILALIQDRVPAAAAAAGVDLVVDRVLFRGDRVEVVDLTFELAAAFEPDATTLESMRQMLTAPLVPVPLEHEP